MSISQTMQEALNKQVALEFSSSYVYLSMAAHFEAENLPGFAGWMRAQSDEEREHAMRIFNFVLDRGGRILLQSIAQPPVEFDTPLAVMRTALEHEMKVTASINALFAQASKEGDYASQVMLQWFVNEQVEEEKVATEIVEHLKLIGKDGPALLLFDRELAARRPAPAAPAESDA